MIRVLLVDDNEKDRSQIREIIDAQENLEVVGETDDADRGYDLYQELSPDLISIDLNLPKGASSLLIEKILEYEPEARILVSIKVQDEYRDLVQFLKSGAQSFVEKPIDTETYLSELLEVCSQEVKRRTTQYVSLERSMEHRRRYNQHRKPHIRIPRSFLLGEISNPHGVDAYDVHSLLSLFPRLTITPGYVLDYVYARYADCGKPLIYARREDDEPLKDVEEYVRQFALPMPDRLFWEGHDPRACSPFFEHILVKPTFLGYFELVVFLTIAQQFYLFGRSLRKRRIVMTSEAGLLTFQREYGNCFLFGSPELQNSIRFFGGFDPDIKIKMMEGENHVSLFSFQRDVGFSFLNFTFSHQDQSFSLVEDSFLKILALGIFEDPCYPKDKSRIY